MIIHILVLIRKPRCIYRQDPTNKSPIPLCIFIRERMEVVRDRVKSASMSTISNQTQQNINWDKVHILLNVFHLEKVIARIIFELTFMFTQQKSNVPSSQNDDFSLKLRSVLKDLRHVLFFFIYGEIPTFCV